MIHIWTIDNNYQLQLNVIELLKYPLLAKIYELDTSKGKTLSKEYYKYLDFITNSSGYCVKHGLNNKEAHEYAFKNTNLPKDYEFPKNHKDILKYVIDELEYDIITDLVNSAVKALKVSAKSLKAYIDRLNELEESDFKDKDGEPIDLSNTVNKVMKTISDIPKGIAEFEVLVNKQKSNKSVLRGANEFESSMEGDDGVESYSPNSK